MRTPTRFSGLTAGLYKLIFLLVLLLALPHTALAAPTTISGFTELERDSRLGLSVTGRVAKIQAQEGQFVEKGQVLLEIDQRLELLETKRRKLLWKNRSEIDSVARQLKTVTSQLAETKALYESSGSVPREELENQELEKELAVIDLKRLEIVEEREELEYNISREDLRKRTLRAPFDGQIVEVLIGLGENSEPDTPLVHLVSTRYVDFVANVELGVSQKLSVGQSVELEFQAGGKTITRNAEVIFISPVIDSASGLRKIKAQFDNEDGEVVPGVTGIMRFDAE